MSELPSAFEVQRDAEVIACMRNLTEFPAAHQEFLGLYHHDANSAWHTLRVTIGMVTSSLILGMDTQFATFCGSMHDIGKQDVPVKYLQEKDPTAEILSQIREPHMNGTRDRFGRLPYFAQKPDVFAVIMRHHEEIANTNGRSAYMRVQTVIRPGHIQRSELTPEIQRMSHILSVSDSADRFTYGFYGEERNPIAQVRNRLDHSLHEATNQLDLHTRALYIAVVPKSIAIIPPDLLMKSMDILM